MSELKQSNVQYDSVLHTYTLNGQKLNGITGMISKHLFPNKFDNVDSDVLEAARVRGKNAHQAIELFDDCGLVTNGFEQMLSNYVEFKDKNGIEVLAGEYIVSDGQHFATPIDMVDYSLNLYDFKFTYSVDKSYLKWQLSIVAFLFEMQNGFKPNKLFGVHINKEFEFELIPIEPLDYSIVTDLLNAEIEGRQYTTNAVQTIDFYPLVELENTLIQHKREIEAIEAQSKQLKEHIYAKMKEYGIKSWEIGGLKITLVADSESETIDTKALKEKEPEIAAKYAKTTKRKGFLKITEMQ